MHNEQQERSPVVNILIAEANEMNCQLVESALRPRRHGVSVVASTVGASEALALLKERAPDVAVISAQLQEGPFEGYRVLRELHALESRTRAILLLGSRERDLVIDAFRCGARGVVFRDEPLKTLGKCIHAVHAGQVWASSEHLGYVLEVLSRVPPVRLREGRGIDLLSKREADVVHLVTDGLTNREIAAQLGLSQHTVRNYLFRAFEKVGVSTRVELVLYCLQERQGGPAPGAG